MCSGVSSVMIFFKILLWQNSHTNEDTETLYSMCINYKCRNICAQYHDSRIAMLKSNSISCYLLNTGTMINSVFTICDMSKINKCVLLAVNIHYCWNQTQIK